jgi:DNA-binding PadR family transcriptional regulator
MAGSPDLSGRTRRVLQALLADPSAETYATQIAVRAQLRAGTVYPTLARLERRGWVESRWEHLDEAQARRPARRCYRLSGTGLQQAAAALSAVRGQPQWRPRLLPDQS